MLGLGLSPSGGIAMYKSLMVYSLLQCMGFFFQGFCVGKSTNHKIIKKRMMELTVNIKVFSILLL